MTNPWGIPFEVIKKFLPVTLTDCGFSMRWLKSVLSSWIRASVLVGESGWVRFDANTFLGGSSFS